MSAFAELASTGSAGRATVELLIRLTGQLGRTSSFPAPLWHQWWTDQAVIDYVGSILSTGRGIKMVTNCAMTATDDSSLERLLLASIRRFMIDEAKATPVGRLRRRLRTLLTRDDRFVPADHLLASQEGWTTTANGDAIWSEDIDELIRLTASVRVAPIDRLNTAGPTPAAARQSLVTMSHEAISRAAGAIRAQLLARFLHLHFALDTAGETTKSEGTVAPTLTLAPDDDVAILARRIFDGLSVEDVALLRELNASADLDRLNPARDALFERLRVYAGSETGRDAVNLVVRLCNAAVNVR